MFGGSGKKGGLSGIEPPLQGNIYIYTGEKSCTSPEMMIHCQYGEDFLLLEGKGGLRHAKGVALLTFLVICMPLF